MNDTIFAWVRNGPDGKLYVMLSEAQSPAEAAERIALKLAAYVDDADRLLSGEKRLRETPPMVMDFSERVGVLTIDIKPRQ